MHWAEASEISNICVEERLGWVAKYSLVNLFFFTKLLYFSEVLDFGQSNAIKRLHVSTYLKLNINSRSEDFHHFHGSLDVRSRLCIIVGLRVCELHWVVCVLKF